MTVITLREWESCDVPISTTVARQLATHPTARIDVAPGVGDQWRLRPSSNVGTLAVGDTRILIRPKIGIRNVLALMDVGPSSLRWSDVDFVFESDDDLLSAMVHVFVRSFDRASAQGIRRDYRSVEDRLVALRGRLDFGALARRPGGLTTVPCLYDDYTPDIGMNRLLLAAVRRAQAVPRVSPLDRRELHRIEGAFEAVVVDANPLAWLDRWVPSRLDRHWEHPVRLAALLLRGLSISDQVGSVAASSFLLDMNELVETYITAHLTANLGADMVSKQHRTTLDVAGRVPIRPDLVFLVDGSPTLVADVKYKVVGSVEEVSTTDLYQVAAYATVLGLRKAVLITCGLESAAVDRTILRQSEVEIEIWPIDLSGDLGQLHRATDRLAERVRAAVKGDHALVA